MSLLFILPGTIFPQIFVGPFFFPQRVLPWSFLLPEALSCLISPWSQCHHWTHYSISCRSLPVGLTTNCYIPITFSCMTVWAQWYMLLEQTRVLIKECGFKGDYLIDHSNLFNPTCKTFCQTLWRRDITEKEVMLHLASHPERSFCIFPFGALR